MKKLLGFIFVLFLAVACQNDIVIDEKPTDMILSFDGKAVDINKSFTQTEQFSITVDEILHGLLFSGEVQLKEPGSSARLIMVDSDYNEYLIYENYTLLDGMGKFEINRFAEETEFLEGVELKALRVELVGAEMKINKLHYDEVGLKSREIRQHDLRKIDKINQNQDSWIAGETGISKLSYSERQQLFGNSTFPDGIEFYRGGVLPSNGKGKGAKVGVKPQREPNPNKGKGKNKDNDTPAPDDDVTGKYVEKFDWRNRHGANWLTSVKDQRSCGSCYVFSTTGVVEALVNLYYNQKINLDLSEQQMLSCSGAGNCVGGWPYVVFDYIRDNYIVDDAAMPYVNRVTDCTYGTPQEKITVSGRVDFSGWKITPEPSFDKLKSMIIQYGPINGGLRDWNHTMVLTGWEDKGSDVVWIFKNSWGASWGDNGYVYVTTTLNNFAWTHAAYGVESILKKYDVVVTDNDGDGYYWWGLGPKPEWLDAPDEPDGDDSDPTKGPMDAFGNLKNI